MALKQRAPEKLKALDNDQKKKVAEAAAVDGLKPDQLIDFEIYWDRVAIILPTGQKHVYSFEYLAEFVASHFKDEPKAKAAAKKPQRTTTRK